MQRLYIFLVVVIAFRPTCAAKAGPCIPPKALHDKLQAHPSAAGYTQLGNWYGDHNRYDCAVEAYQSGLKRAPQSSELLYLLGLNLLRKGDAAGAVKPLQESIQIKADMLKPHLLLATALEQVNRPAEARDEWLASVKIDPQSEMALAGASKNLLAANDYATVISLLGPQPKADELVVNLAWAYHGLGDNAQSIEVLKKALQASPSSNALTRALITFLVSQARYQEAAELAKKLVEQNPRDFDAQVLYLHVLVLADDEDKARPLAQKLLARAPHNFSVLYLNGVLEHRSGNFSAAKIHLEEAVTLNPGHYNAHYNLGIVLSQLKDLQGAREQFEKALALGAYEPQVRFEYAKVLRLLGETKLAQEELERYQKEQKAQADRTLAASKMAQADKEMAVGHPQEAAGLYRDAVTAQPDNAVLSLKLALALDRAGDKAGEMEALKKTLQLDPKMPVAHYQLAHLASLTGDFVLAEEHYRDAVQVAPAYVDAWIGLAAILGTESRYPEAQNALESALQIDPKNANAIQLQKELATAAKTNQ
jgi:tetratricopeptide (TPR) repeat protein